MTSDDLTTMPDAELLDQYCSLYWTQYWGGNVEQRRAARREELDRMRTEILRRMG